MASEKPEISNDSLGFTITSQEFLLSAKTFIEKSDKLYDGWVLTEEKGTPFIKLITIQKMDVKDEGKENKVCSNISLEYHIVYSVSYCVPVLYMRAFDPTGRGLPVDKLILKGQISREQESIAKEKTDTGLQEEILNGKDPHSTAIYSSASHSFVRPDTFSQAPHPLLFVPFYKLHPCHTAEWMKMVNATKNEGTNSQKRMKFPIKTYIVAWLSFVGPNIGIYLDNKYMLS